MSSGSRLPSICMWSSALGRPRMKSLRAVSLMQPDSTDRHPSEGESVPSAQQPARHDLRLDLGGAFEDVEDPRVAEDAADRVFLGVAVAAVDLQRIVGVRPGAAC